LSGIRGRWRLCRAIVFCKCHREYLGPTGLARLFDDADHILFAHPGGTVRVVLYAIGVWNGLRTNLPNGCTASEGTKDPLLQIHRGAQNWTES